MGKTTKNSFKEKLLDKELRIMGIYQRRVIKKPFFSSHLFLLLIWMFSHI